MISRPNILQDVKNDLAFFFPLWIGRIDHVKDQVRFNHLFKRRSKSRYKLMGQLPYESDGVGYQDRVIAPQLNPSNQRIESGEQPAGYESVLAGQRAEDRRFSCIRVPDKRHQGQVVLSAPIPMELAVLSNLLDLATQNADAMPDLASIHFQL